MTIGPGQDGGENVDAREGVGAGGDKKRRRNDGRAAGNWENGGGRNGYVSSSSEEEGEDGGGGAGTGAVENGGQTIAERLKSLNKTLGYDSDSSCASSSDAASPAGTATAPVKADTLTHLLTQSLTTSDDAQLEVVLSSPHLTARPTSLRLTLSALSPSHCRSLLGHLTSRIHRRPARIEQLHVWVRALLKERQSVFGREGGGREELRGLGNLMRERTDMLPGLMRLKGRLGLLGEEGEE